MNIVTQIDSVSQVKSVTYLTTVLCLSQQPKKTLPKISSHRRVNQPESPTVFHTAQKVAADDSTGIQYITIFPVEAVACVKNSILEYSFLDTNHTLKSYSYH